MLFEGINHEYTQPSGQSAHQSPTAEPPFVCPTVSVVPYPESGIVKLYLHDLPQPGPDYNLNTPTSCVVSQIIHQYKRLITEGDRLGQAIYQRKVTHNRRIKNPKYVCEDPTPIRLENPYFRADVSYSITYDTTNRRLIVCFVLGHTSTATFSFDGGCCHLPDHEALTYIQKFCNLCAEELIIHFQAAYYDACERGYAPDFYGVLPKTDPTSTASP